MAEVFFLIMKTANKMKDVAMKLEGMEPEAAMGPTTEELLVDIRDVLKAGA